jgi:hypothetical protein
MSGSVLVASSSSCDPASLDTGKEGKGFLPCPSPVGDLGQYRGLLLETLIPRSLPLRSFLARGSLHVRCRWALSAGIHIYFYLSCSLAHYEACCRFSRLRLQLTSTSSLMLPTPCLAACPYYYVRFRPDSLPPFPL